MHVHKSSFCFYGFVNFFEFHRFEGSGCPTDCGGLWCDCCVEVSYSYNKRHSGPRGWDPRVIQDLGHTDLESASAALEVQRGAGAQLVEHMRQYDPALGCHYPVCKAEEAEVWVEVAAGKPALDVGTHALPGVVAKILALSIVSRYARVRHGPTQVLGSKASH